MPVMRYRIIGIFFDREKVFAFIHFMFYEIYILSKPVLSTRNLLFFIEL